MPLRGRGQHLPGLRTRATWAGCRRRPTDGVRRCRVAAPSPQRACHVARMTPNTAPGRVSSWPWFRRPANRHRADARPNASVLDCIDLRKRFGEIEAVRGVSFKIAEGETYGLLGSERRGQDDDDLDRLRPARARRGRGACRGQAADHAQRRREGGDRLRPAGAGDLSRSERAREPPVLRPAVRAAAADAARARRRGARR